MADTTRRVQVAYKIIGKTHRRLSIVHQSVIALDGTHVDVPQNGPMFTYPVGTILTDVTSDELAAFPDRFALASPEEIAAAQAIAAHTEHMAMATAVAEDDYAEKLLAVKVEHAAVLAKLQAEHAAHLAAMTAEKDAKIAEAEAKLAEMPAAPAPSAPRHGPPRRTGDA